MYAIIDVETTGLKAATQKIIDIAIVLHDGRKVVDEFQSLINPERNIPANITRLTGITNHMVEEAPKFWEVARDIVLMTRDKTFVAHNVNFDYSFVRKEFSELGYAFKRRKLCTVQLSRKLLPGKKSYSLGNICQELGCDIEDRHRAYGDARATALLFTHLMALDQQEKEYIPPQGMSDLRIIRNLPPKTGVYYFLNDQGDVIYIGKSKSIRSRVLNHFQDARTRRSRNMLEQIHDISYETTGSELIALLKESHEIKQYKPMFNRRQRRGSTDFGVYYYHDSTGYIRFQVSRNKDDQGLLAAFSSYREARAYLFNLCGQYNLCQKFCGLYESAGACFYYHVDQCAGACAGEESAENYNRRALQAIENLNLEHENFFIVESGRNAEELAVVQIENNHYRGYGYLYDPASQGNLELLRDVINPLPDNQDIQRILRHYLRTGNHFRIIPY
ncbi:MAG: GIY-YIG nuclease family protein [Bacteroidales bacterium]|nr:GIY-YIG nuclease family protein [Bacteroidales bacterium]